MKLPDDPECGLGSLMMGAGSDWDVTPNNSEPISDEERERLIEIAKDMGRRAGEQINKMLIEAYREIA